MSFFTGPLRTEEAEGGWVLTQTLTYYSRLLGRNVDVPAGFFTDLASVPRLMRWLVPVANAKNRKAAVVHDYLCSDEVQAEYGITQRKADEVFREALAVCNVNPVGQWCMWLPVRTFQSIKSFIGK